MTIQGKKLDEHLKEPPPRIEFLEYLKKEFIQWWEERKERKQKAYLAERLRRYDEELKKELAELSGRKLAAFSGFLLQLSNDENSLTLLQVYNDYKRNSMFDYGIRNIRQYGLFNIKDDKNLANP